ncbi:DUF6377 domain-containing protein [Parabacteroides pacaensis]|uniref:DUF6377 domain-containing protein n=1 Tax=Parabacteroides pacaensis TaxID=2086575 RepID=UPI000D10B5F6|nr:DUF6377 domain-containing protein [Parabacteroides pacaensis]
MRHLFLCMQFIICYSLHLYADKETDSLLMVLDRTIAERPVYIEKKVSAIKELKRRKQQLKTLEELYLLNNEIIHQYESFICDSAELYINENIRIAEKLNHKEHLLESSLQLAFIYSLSGLFVQASDLFNSMNWNHLPSHIKVGYCWTYIRYYENLIKYTDDTKFSNDYKIRKEVYRDSVMSLLYEKSDEYLKEKAFKLQEEQKFEDAIHILTQLYDKQEYNTHGYAMAAMALARIHRQAGNAAQEEKFLIQAAITDITLAVKENEALLSLAINLYKKGDIDRAYNYIKIALEDAIFYNSRFRNTVIARVHPIIENTYLYKIEQQKRNLRFYSILTSFFIIALAVALYFIYRQIKVVSRARKHLKEINKELSASNQKLDEANLIKEKYIGYFMNQCAVYINKLNEYRKNVNRKIKTGQIDDLYKSSARPFDKEMEELYFNFDRAFLNLYPHFVTEFNSLLKPDEQFKLEKGRLNTELRIFALIRLGITDVTQISKFLHYSLQTIYNYKSKVKKVALIESSLFEEEVKKLGSLT